MQSDLFKIVGGLIVHAGMLMEDIGPELIASLPGDRGIIFDRLDLMERSGRDLMALAAAGRVLLRIAAEDANAD